MALISKISVPAIPSLDDAGESLWVDVIHRMDEVYAELLRNEADLSARMRISKRRNPSSPVSLPRCRTFSSSAPAAASSRR